MWITKLSLAVLREFDRRTQSGLQRRSGKGQSTPPSPSDAGLQKGPGDHDDLAPDSRPTGPRPPSA